MAEIKIKERAPVVQIKQNAYRWNVGTYTTNFIRQFPSNTILFINNGTSDIKINDIFTLPVGANMSLEGNQNEVDFTMYKVAFIAGGSLEVWYKEDAGMQIVSEYATDTKVKQSDMPNRRDQEKNRVRYPRDKGDF